MLVTALSQIKGTSSQVGWLTTVPLYTETLLPPPSRFCRKVLQSSMCLPEYTIYIPVHRCDGPTNTF